MRFKH